MSNATCTLRACCDCLQSAAIRGRSMLGWNYCCHLCQLLWPVGGSLVAYELATTSTNPGSSLPVFDLDNRFNFAQLIRIGRSGHQRSGASFRQAEGVCAPQPRALLLMGHRDGGGSKSPSGCIGGLLWTTRSILPMFARPLKRAWRVESFDVASSEEINRDTFVSSMGSADGTLSSVLRRRRARAADSTTSRCPASRASSGFSGPSCRVCSRRAQVR